jgi:hypothetical protein
MCDAETKNAVHGDWDNIKYPEASAIYRSIDKFSKTFPCIRSMNVSLSNYMGML